jgi:hypothetical protein
MWAHPSRPDLAQTDLAAPDLEDRYRAYRKRQARLLLDLLPREAIRPLYRRALTAGDDSSPTDPLAALERYCESLLCMPPFEVWSQDLAAYPEAHAREMDEGPAAPTVEAPLTLAARTVVYEGLSWSARLRSFRDGFVWRAYIAFDRTGSNLRPRTAAIFREEHPSSLRERFLDLEGAAMEAFLRSSLP